MKKSIVAFILCLLSSTAFVYSIITCYYFLYAIVFVLSGFLMLASLYILSNKMYEGKHWWTNLLLAINAFIAVGAIGSLYYIYNKDDGKITYSITHNQTLSELGIMVAEYRLANYVNIENVDIQSEMNIAYESTYEVFNDRSKIRVDPELYNLIVSMSGDKVVSLFDWRNKKYSLRESYVELTTIRNDNDGTPVYTTGDREIVDSIKAIPDTVTFHIYNRQTNKNVDSLVFVKNKEYDNLSAKAGSKVFTITRKRTLIDKIKDLYLID